MTYDRAQKLMSRAKCDYTHAARALANAETPAAQRRHARRMRRAESAIRDLQRDLASLGCEATG
jgi:hypothetical protein